MSKNKFWGSPEWVTLEPSSGLQACPKNSFSTAMNSPLVTCKIAKIKNIG
jgi:hypothetical protein